MIIERDLYTIAEFAEERRISKQAVYKQLNNKLKPFVVEVDGKKYIKKEAFFADEANQNNQESQPNNQPFNQPNNQNNQPFQHFLEQQIAEKDKQIENLMRQLEVLQQQNSNLTEIVRNSQVLLAAEKKILLGQESQEQQEPKKKRFLWGKRKEK
jgi:hypothetical protein